MAKRSASNAAQRVFVSVSRKSRHWPRAWDHSEEVIKAAITCIKENDSVVFGSDMPLQLTVLVRERWTSRLWIVFDVFNNSYDTDSADLPDSNDLPVILLSLSEKDVVTTSKLIEDKVNRWVREAHDLHGVGSLPPFNIDHANGQIASYPNPQIQGF